jgi:hypothetical protein
MTFHCASLVFLSNLYWATTKTIEKLYNSFKTVFLFQEEEEKKCTIVYIVQVEFGLQLQITKKNSVVSKKKITRSDFRSLKFSTNNVTNLK